MAVVRVGCCPEAHVVLETCVNQSFVDSEDSTDLLDFVTFSGEEKRNLGLEVTGFHLSHLREQC